jgi:hypothetical protein
MAVAAHVVLRGISKEQYDQVRAEVGWRERPPDGGLSYVAWWEGEDWHSVGAWESEAAFEAFGQDRLGPAMAKLGIDISGERTLHPAHEVYTPRSATLA